MVFPTANHNMYRGLQQLFVQNLSENVRKCLDQLNSKGEKFYEGYCDDPRNTDNAWLEVVAYNHHDDTNALSTAIDQVLLQCISNLYFFYFSTRNQTTINYVNKFTSFLGDRSVLSDRCLSVCPVCLSVTFVHCGQTVGRIKVKLGVQVALGTGHIVVDGNPALLPKKGA